jgi:hypothetical protein
MKLDAAAQIGEAMGGLAGLTALGWNIVDTVRRRRAARAPELRALLTQIVALIDEVIRKSQSYEWCRERLDPVTRDLNRLQPVLSRSVQLKVGSLYALLSLVQATGLGINDNTPPAEIARMSITQKRLLRKP